VGGGRGAWFDSEAPVEINEPPPSSETHSRTGRSGRKKSLAATGWLRAIDTRGKQEPREFGIGHGRGAIVVGLGAVWVAHGYGRSLARLDPETLDITGALRLGKPPTALEVGLDTIWVLGANGWLWRIHPAKPDAEGVARLGRQGRALAWSDGSLWALRRGGELAKVDPISGELTLEVRVPRRARHLVAHGDALWTSTDQGRTLLRIDPISGAIEQEIEAPGRTGALALDGDVLWAAWRQPWSRRKGRISGFDSRSGELIEERWLPELPHAVVADAKAVWIACGRPGKREASIVRLDLGSEDLTTIDSTRMPVCQLALAGPLLLATLSWGFNSFAADGSGMIFFEGGDLGGGMFDGGGGGGGDGGGGGGS
jgi:streptogramin lyase